MLPDTDAMSPATRSPGLFGLAVVAGPEGDAVAVAFAVVAGAGVLDELHAARATAAALVSAMIRYRMRPTIRVAAGFGI